MPTSSTFDASALNILTDFLPNDTTDPNSWSTLQLTMLLIGIVEGSNGILDTKYGMASNVIQVIETHTYLREILVAAWNNKDYKEVLNTPILRATFSVSLASSRSSPVAKYALSQKQTDKLLSGMLQVPYRGVAVHALYGFLEQNNRIFRDKTHYAKFCSVVQSSGTGKTRTILELARKGVLLLYMNLRPDADKSGFPARDDVPAQILTGYCTSEKEYYIQCCALFSAIFKLVRDDLSALDGTPAAVKSWNTGMCELLSPCRTDFFQRLKSAYNQIKSCHSTTGTAVDAVLECYRSMNKVFASVFPSSPTTDNKPRLVIALDEAHTLHEVKDYATVLCRVISQYSQKTEGAVWVLFASTTSKVSDFASPLAQGIFNSARVAVHGLQIFAPFCELGWDQCAPRLSEVPPGEVAKVKHIMRYGRPLWLSLKPEDEDSLQEILDLAVQKLIAREQYDARDMKQALAVLGQRFCLDACFGHQEAVQFIKDAVASHLRVIIKTTEDRTWSYTAYPSEPFLSCAAAYSLHKEPDSLRKTLDTLKVEVDSGMIDIGQCGELVSRLLWLLAKDLFVILEKKSRELCTLEDGFDTELFHCSMIPVVVFFEFVFGEDFWSDHAGSEAEKAFKDAYVNFSHWISMESLIRQDERKVGDQLSLNQWTMRHWQRTCAIQCCHDQPDIDKVIPIYFKSVDPGESGVDCMSQIMISDKARVDKQSDVLNKIVRTHPTIGGAHENSSKPLPYIAIVADLGLDTPKLKVTFPTWSSERKSTDASCLRIQACALAPETYPFLNDYPDMLRLLKSLLDRKKIPASNGQLASLEYLRDQVKYGNSAEIRYMEWDREDDVETAFDPANQKMIIEIQNEAALEQEQSSLESNRDRKAPQEASDPNSEWNRGNNDKEAMVIDDLEKV